MKPHGLAIRRGERRVDSPALASMRERWDGDRWRWWSLLAGFALLPVSAALAGIVGLITGERMLPLILLILVVEIFVTSIVGSGLLDGMTSKMSRGGLTREGADFVDRAETEAELEAIEERQRELKDRRTVRAGIFVLPLIVAFVALLTRA